MPSYHVSQTRRWLLRFPLFDWALKNLRELLIGSLQQGPIPRHVAFVMDGNRRFARQQRLETVEGHNLGFEALAKILEVCYKSGVQVVTIYAFSIENFNRSKYEVDALMEMAKTKLIQLSTHGDLLDRYGACVRVLGQRELLKPDVLEAIDRAVDLTKHNTDAILNVCFPYTSRAEITTAIQTIVSDFSNPIPEPQRQFSETNIAQKILKEKRSQQPPGSPPDTASVSSASEDDFTASSSSSTLHADFYSPSPKGAVGTLPDPEEITERTLASYLYTGTNPPLDLLVRTSGVERLSDFMLWQCHEETDIVFLKCMWPEFDLWTFLPVLVEWQWRAKRRQSASDEGDWDIQSAVVKNTARKSSASRRNLKVA